MVQAERIKRLPKKATTERMGFSVDTRIQMVTSREMANITMDRHRLPSRF
jgi:hypothetical protein